MSTQRDQQLSSTFKTCNVFSKVIEYLDQNRKQIDCKRPSIIKQMNRVQKVLTLVFAVWILNPLKLKYTT